MRAGFVKVLGLKVIDTSSKRYGAARVPNSRHTKRTFGRSSLDTLERSVSRQVSESQNLRKDELVDRTRLQIELLDRFAVQNSQYSLRNRYCCVA